MTKRRNFISCSFGIHSLSTCLFMQLSGQPTMWQQCNADTAREQHITSEWGEKSLSDFDTMVGARAAGSSIPETVGPLGFLHATDSGVYSEWCEKNQKPQSSRARFVDMTVKVQWSSVASPSRQIWIQRRALGMWWSGRLAAWMYRWQICRNEVMQSCQHGAESFRGLPPRSCEIHVMKNWRWFWTPREELLSISTVHLIKRSVSVNPNK